jgi:hypothetical protein
MGSLLKNDRFGALAGWAQISFLSFSIRILLRNDQFGALAGQAQISFLSLLASPSIDKVSGPRHHIKFDIVRGCSALPPICYSSISQNEYTISEYSLQNKL